MTKYMLTTTDNPYNPFTHFKEWFSYDSLSGYNSSGFLARIANSSENLSEADQELAIEQAIDEIVAENVLGLYRKVSQNN